MTSEPYRSQGIPNKSQEARGACPPLNFAMMNRFFQPPDCHFMQEDGSFSIVPDIETDMGAAFCCVGAAFCCVTRAFCCAAFCLLRTRAACKFGRL